MESESVWRVGCDRKALAEKEYKRRYNRMGLRVYWELCRKNGLKCAEKWF